MRECKECGKQYEGNFCPYCGAKWTEEQATERICPDCGKKVAPGMRFCANCGYDFSKKKSSDEIKAEKRMQAAMLRTANFVEAIPTMFRVGNGVLSVIFSALLWVLFALPVTTILGENIGNLYQFMSGTTELGEFLEPMGGIIWVIFLAVVTTCYALFVLYLLIADRKDEKAHTKHNIYNIVFLVFHIAFFVVGCIVRSKVSDFGLTVGACANSLMICSSIFFVLSLALSIVSCILLEKAKAPLTPEEVAAKEARKAALIEKAKRIAKPIGTVGALALVVLIIVGISSNIFRAGKVDNIAIGDSEETVLAVLGEPYKNSTDGALFGSVKAEYTKASHDTVWKYYSKSYTKIYDKIAELEEKGENMSSLGDLGDILEEGLSLSEEALKVRYKYIEVAFKDGAVVAVYLDKDKCDTDIEKKNSDVKKLSFEPFEYTGCDGGGYGQTQLTVKYADGSYANNVFSVEIVSEYGHKNLKWRDFNGEHAYTLSSWDVVEIGTTQHNVEEWKTTKELTCTEDGEEKGRCSWCGSTQYRTLPATGHSVEQVDIILEPPCVRKGLKLTEQCANCGEHMKTETIPAGHLIQNGICSVCSYVSALGNNTYIRVDAEGKKDEAGSYILFGEYPQTIKAENVTVGTTTDSRGYYLGSDGFYYAKVTADPYENGYTFSSGTAVEEGVVYYFKVEPIRWRILTEDGDTALILCDCIIANKRFDDDSNNYKDSEIRAWLNAEFYNTAFGSLQKELINTVLVDNSVASTGYSSNPWACEDTNDKVFLLSCKEVAPRGNGKTISDYAYATGAYSSLRFGNGGIWYLRSPTIREDHVCAVGYDGVKSCIRGLGYEDAPDHTSVYNISSGVVPALQIRLN